MDKIKSNKNTFIKNIWVLMSGSTIAQVILVLFSPVLTRLYSPDQFGILALYMSIVSIIATAASARYEQAIIKPKKYLEALSLLILSMILISVVSIGTFIVTLLFYHEIASLMHLKNFSFIILFIALSVFITSSYTVFTMWHTRNEDFLKITYASVARSTFISVLQTMLYKSNIGLIIGQVLGNGLSLIFLIKQFIQNDAKKIKHISRAQILKVLHKYKNFPKYNLPHVIVGTLKINATVILISSFFGNVALGYYTLALRVLLLPISVIATSVNHVYYQKIATMHTNGEDIMPFTLKTIRNLSLIALPIFAIIFFIAPRLFAFIFGEEWHEVGKYVQALTVYMFLMFVVSSINSIPLVFNKQKVFFVWGLVEAAIMLFSFIVGKAVHLNIIDTLYLFSFTTSIYMLALCYWFFTIIKNEVQ